MENEPIAIRLHNLNKTFGRRKKVVHAVHDVNLTVESGQVFGFLGPNGAGKSTTIRMLMDLIRPTDGHVELYGRSPQQDLTILQRVGALVEGATFYDFLTGRKNLEVLAKTSGWQDPNRIQTLLEQVGMADRADRNVKGYSTGMKQRLGIAAAMLNDPDLLILDEPTNGLDPAGIKEIRILIRDLVENQGKTIFLSSHLLSEIEQMCDSVAIITEGRLIREGKVADLLATQSHIMIEAEPIEKAVQLLQPDWSAKRHGATLQINAPRSETPAIVNRLTSNEIAIYQVKAERQSLEDFFISATNAPTSGEVANE